VRHGHLLPVSKRRDGQTTLPTRFIYSRSTRYPLLSSGLLIHSFPSPSWLSSCCLHRSCRPRPHSYCVAGESSLPLPSFLHPSLTPLRSPRLYAIGVGRQRWLAVSDVPPFLRTLSPTLCDLHASREEDDNTAPTRLVGRDLNLWPPFPLPPPVDLDLSSPPLFLYLRQLLLLLVLILLLLWVWIYRMWWWLRFRQALGVQRLRAL